MYHCHIQFYYVGSEDPVWEVVKGITPLDHFSHAFSNSDRPDAKHAAEADVILVNMENQDVLESLEELVENKTPDCQLIVLAKQEVIAQCTEWMAEINDIWTMPMSDAEIRFRFQRWQQSYRQEKEFWQTSQYLEATINNIPSLVWYKDKDGIHEKVNDSFCRTVNKKKQQVEGRGHAYIWDVEQDDPACIESEQKVMSKRKTYVSEEIIQTGRGERILTTYKSPLYDLDGSVMGTVGVGIDISQERAYEEEIVQKNVTLERIFTTLDCGVMRHTVDGSRIISVNRAALKILGYESREELEKAGFAMIAPSVMEEDQEKLRSCIKQLKEEGDNVNVEYRVKHQNGEILHVMGNVKLLQENGELFYQRFLLDCTTQKLREKRERMEHEKRQMELVQALSIDFNLVCFFDLDTGKGSSLRVDDGYHLENIFSGEIMLQESMEQYIQTFVLESDQEVLRLACSVDNLRGKLEQKSSYYVNYRIFRDGELKYYQMRAVRTGVWEENHGIVIGFRSVDEEIRSEMEQNALLEEALLEANKANKAKSVFLSNMSHDIRTPMNAIVGFTTLALTHLNNSEQVEGYLNKIMTSGNHLLNLINDVLDMSRIESGKMQLDEKPCNLSEIVHGLCNIIQADARKKQMELSVDIVDVWDEEIHCDELRLNQVLLNLLSNAIKYTPEGGKIYIRVTERPAEQEDSAEYEFYIQDNGIGMSEEFVARIFDPFEREQNSTINKIQGTGLGMAITKNIVELMNGTIAVQSEQDVGTEVILNFTFHKNTEAKEAQILPEYQNYKALVVNGNSTTCDSVASMLKRMGMHADQAVSAQEAIQQTQKAKTQGDSYRVYVIDRMLPDQDGIDLTRQIREELSEDNPVILLSAYDWSGLEEDAREAGVAAFCNKPLFFSEIRKSLQETGDQEQPKNKSSQEEMAVTHAGRILLAEDLDLNQEIAEAILTEAGFQVEIADNGQIAVEMLENSESGYYQLILMDIQMPVMNGYEATKAIRKLKNKELAAVPIVAMSANAFEEDKQEALQAGMNGHIAKPIDVKVLFETLQEILSDR
ncbi:MAG: response regulator [Lachnospiraceae bacterium]|nr:response regulator [Lachnospiraceae bacterium]